MDVRVGERFVLGFSGTTIPAWLEQFEHEHGLGGVGQLLFQDLSLAPRIEAICVTC